MERIDEQAKGFKPFGAEKAFAVHAALLIEARDNPALADDPAHILKRADAYEAFVVAFA